VQKLLGADESEVSTPAFTNAVRRCVARVVGVSDSAVTGDFDPLKPLLEGRRERHLGNVRDVVERNELTEMSEKSDMEMEMNVKDTVGRSLLTTNVTLAYALKVVSTQTPAVVTKKVTDAIDNGDFFRDLRELSGVNFGASSVASVVNVTPIPLEPTQSPSNNGADSFIKKRSG
jgi:hypothetical protein